MIKAMVGIRLGAVDGLQRIRDKFSTFNGKEDLSKCCKCKEKTCLVLACNLHEQYFSLMDWQLVCMQKNIVLLHKETEGFGAKFSSGFSSTADVDGGPAGHVSDIGLSKHCLGLKRLD